MDKGAHFFKCDFQVHTPRDIQWSGSDAVTDDERKEYAENLINKCREIDINAIAITDHHDFVFYPYIKQAAANELCSDGTPVSNLERIIVFPGLELTLSSPACQAILILDSNFPVNLLQNVLTFLAINPNPANESKTAHTTPIPNTIASDFKELYDKLNSLEYLENRFIIFPNVSDSGYKTLFRTGFNNYYKSMPCVGGYIDGSITSLGNGKKTILEGKNREYGFKSIAALQTSDNRKASHEDLGKFCTWVKWAEPTAEALRQACLAKNSRISHDTPVLPPIFITSLDVSNSKFLGRIYLELNQQYNAIIGGRGTGKSTILEYLRWGLCDQSPDISDDEGIPSYQERRKKLIDKTLLPYEATVQISFIKNNIPHIIRRKSSTHEILLKIGSEEFQICSEEDVRNILPVQAYSQKQLSSVGVSMEELQRLIYSPIRQELTDYEARFKRISTDIRSCYEKKLQKKLINAEIEKNDLELKSLTEQVEKLRKGLKGISDDDRNIIESHANFDIYDQLIDGWKAELSSTSESIDLVIKELSAYPTPIPLESTLPDKEQKLVEQMHQEIRAIFSSAQTSLNILKDKLNGKDENLEKFNETLASWQLILDQHNKKYNSAKEKSSSQEVTLKEIQKLEKRDKEVRKSLSEKKQKLSKIGNPEVKFESLKEEWLSAHRERADQIEYQCSQLERLSDNNIRASIGRGKGTKAIVESLKGILLGSKFRNDKINDICSFVSNEENPIQTWHQLLLEFEELANFDMEIGNNTLPLTPILKKSGLISNDISKIADKMNPENWINLFLVEIVDLPRFEYKTRDGEYIEFSDASAGQQATALIHVLLNQEGPPLIIDQPEDDLDNQMVSEIADLICKSKNQRQLIFTSHNANIVVNGDAELVICCDYKVTGDQSKGEIRGEGAIDIADIRTSITRVMEGGEKAFKLRKDKYGF